uniref:Putative CENPB/ARS binding proteinlike protein n=1 Tax=Albugo laibachii Nc14 TaxID=890382 RepID=F0W3V6_9STRA|nr:putative CENPB/ARS binding proteinlike protein [Albugo laibachii Nc14]|eukprot:CCA15706.1 putative CENPB/ARS binding proteinlike protein [Albugo laibachii Nc14]
MRGRLTINQQRTLVQHHANNDALTRHELELWVTEGFALPGAPSVSNVSQLLKRFHVHTELLQPCHDANVSVTKISMLLDAQLLVWIEEAVSGSLARAHIFRDGHTTFNVVTTSSHGVRKQKPDQLVLPQSKKRAERCVHALSTMKRKMSTISTRQRSTTVSRPPETIFTKPTSGRKSDKKRLTVAANADGTEKLPFLFVEYANTKKGWMMHTLFQELLDELNESMKKEGRHVLLLLVKASAPCAEKLLSNVEIEMFPPNTTSVLHPMDACVIACPKAYFHRRQGCQAFDVADSVIDDEEKSA